MDSLETVEIAVRDLANTRYLTFAALALLLYDHIITIVDEVTLIWPAKNGPIKMVFLFNRYTVPLALALACCVLSGVVPNLSNKSCQIYTTVTICHEVVALLTTTFVVTTRVYSLWGNQRHAFTFLAGLWGVHLIADIVVATRTLTSQIPLISYEPNLNVCTNTNSPGNWVVWLNGIVFNAILIFLLVWAWLSTPRNAQTPLMALIVRDGCIYFVVIFAAMLFNLLVWKYGRATQAVLPFFAVWAATTMALSRLLLSIKDVQGPEDWGQQARINVPDLELSAIQERRPVRVISRFSEDEDGEDTYSKKPNLAPKLTQVGRYDSV